jgi:hypothetical protein
VVGGAEGLHALAFQLRSDRGEVDAGVLCFAEDVLGRAGAVVGAAGGLPVVGEGAQRGLGHGVDDVWRDELLDVQDV